MNVKEKEQSQFIWYNPISQEYEMGSALMYKKKKSNSTIAQDFTLLYKLNATSTRLGQKLINELNKARKTQNDNGNYFELNLAS